jgi:shikimate dehydrogenase
MAEPRAFVAGHPIAHSRSPLIHGYWLRQHGLAGSYERLDIKPEMFADFLSRLSEEGYVGGNVTIPHKEAAWRLVDRRDAAAEAIGAVNTLWFEEGALCGGNTDAYGFAAHLDASTPDWRGASAATVLGAGGAARAIAYALVEAGLTDIRIVNRTAQKARDLAEGLGPALSAHEWGDLPGLLDDSGLLVNTTPLGMDGREPAPVPLHRLPKRAIVNDIVYAPLVTPLLREAASLGCRTVDGLGMLLHQAAPGFERWFGVRPEVSNELRGLIVADLEGAAARGAVR